MTLQTGDFESNFEWVKPLGGEGDSPVRKNTKFVDAFDYLEAIQSIENEEKKEHATRRRNWVKHDAAARLLQGTKQDRVCYCKRSVAYGAKGVSCVVTDQERASWGNLTLCGNIWTCPHCSPIISAERGAEVNKGLEWSRERILYFQANGNVRERIRAMPMMLTLTVRHGKDDVLTDLSNAMIGAKQEMFQTRVWKRLRVKLVWQPVFLKLIGEDECGNPIHNETLEDTGEPCLIERVRKTKIEPILDPTTGRQVLNKDGTPKNQKISVNPYKAVVQKQRCTGWVPGSGSVIGIVVAYEITHTAGGGWHPHFHIVVFLDTTTEKQARRILSPLRKAWLLALKNNGLYAKSEVGFSVDGAQQVGNYVAKFGAGTGLELTDERKSLSDARARGDWGMVEELTATRQKKARKPGSGVNPWQLLEQYAHPHEIVIEDRKDLTPKKAGFLFAEFAQAFHGRQQLQFSPGLKDLVGLRDRTDEELMEEVEAEEETRLLALVPIDDWRYLCSFTSRADRNDFLRYMHFKEEDEFWEEFEVFLGRKR